MTGDHDDDRAALVRTLKHRDTHAVEQMDDAECDPVFLRRTYERFPLINALVSGWHSTYRQFIRPSLSPSTMSTLLDIGSGAGDIPRALNRWAERDGLLLEILAIDPDPRAHRFATAQTPQQRLSFRMAFSTELVAEGARFDFVMSNHVLHHLTDDERSQLLHDSERLTVSTAIHTDIARSRLAYVGFAAMTVPVAYKSFIRADGLTSIRRSYTHSELAAIAPPNWEVQQPGLFRLALVWKPSSDSA